MVRPQTGDEVRELPVDSPAEFRLRHLLLLLCFLGAAAWCWPRSAAAWRLHSVAEGYADYALCMVGPMGPEFLREAPDKFRKLIRRRVVSAAPDDQPLIACKQLAATIGISGKALAIHSERAVSFDVYHNTPGSNGQVSLEQLDLSLTRLHSLADDAWPFIRGDGLAFMKESSHAREASHSPNPPRAGKGRGLPQSRQMYRSTAAYGNTIVVSFGSGANGQTLLSKNGGIDWKQGGGRLSTALRDRCVADDNGRAFTLTKARDGQRIVISHGPGAAPQIAVLSTQHYEVAGISCDESALVAALVSAPDATGYRPVQLKLCPFRGACRVLVGPPVGGDQLYYPMDVARLGGDTVIARTSGGLTRVASSRDDGRSWLQWTVVFDSSLNPTSVSAPFRLLVAADKIFLYSGGRSSEEYPLLISSDHGASFASPSTTTFAPVAGLSAKISSPKQ